eukprot:722310_1
MVTSRLDSIISFVEQANTPSDLTRLISMLISHIPLTVLQTFVKHHVQSSSNLLINRMYRDVLPIDHILPDDLIQNVLSFDRLSLAPKAVSKAFRRLSGKNDSIELKQRNKIIQDPQYDFKIDFQSETRWIVCTNPNRHQLSEEQLVNGYKGPFKLGNALKQCQDEDVLLLYDGEHTISESLFLTKNKALSLIGMSDNVVITIASLRTPIGDIDLESIKLYFNNVHLRGSHSALEIDIDRDAHLWMEQCIVNLSLHITLGIDSSLHVKNCDFKGENQMSTSIVIKVDFEDVGSEVTIVGSTFTGWGSLAHAQETELPCIDIYSCGSDDTIIVEPHITIVGNIFSNNKGRSIVFDSTEMKHSNIPQIEYFLESNVTVHDNISQNKNGRLKDQISPFQKPNPNQIQILYNSDEES